MVESFSVRVVVVLLVASLGAIGFPGAEAIRQGDFMTVPYMPGFELTERDANAWADEHSIYDQSFVPNTQDKLVVLAEVASLDYREINAPFYKYLYFVHVRAIADPSYIRTSTCGAFPGTPYDIGEVGVKMNFHDTSSVEMSSEVFYAETAHRYGVPSYNPVQGWSYEDRLWDGGHRTSSKEEWIREYNARNAQNQFINQAQTAWGIFKMITGLPSVSGFEKDFLLKALAHASEVELVDTHAGFENGVFDRDWQMQWSHQLNFIKNDQGPSDWLHTTIDIWFYGDHAVPVDAPIPTFDLDVFVSFQEYFDCQEFGLLSPPDLKFDIQPLNPADGPSAVWNVPPQAFFLEPSPSSADLLVPITFQAGCDAEGCDRNPGDTVYFRFNFGDGSPWTSWSTGMTTTHPYSSPGTFTATLEVTDDLNFGDGHHDFPNQKTRTVTISNIPPTPVTLSSSTHPEETTWYSNDDPVISWTASSDGAGIAGYYYLLSRKNPDPPGPSRGTFTTDLSVSLFDVDDGEWFFHVRAKDNSGTLSQTSTRRIRIDIQPPRASVWSLSGGVVTALSTYYRPDQPLTLQIGIEASAGPSGLWKAEGSSAFGQTPLDDTPETTTPQFVITYTHTPGVTTPFSGLITVTVFSNAQPPLTQIVQVEVMIDDQPPILQSFGLFSGQTFTTQRDVTLKISATDGIGVGLSDMRLGDRPSMWESRNYVTESSHPYPDNADLTYTIKQFGARFIDIYFEYVDLAVGNCDWDDELTVWDETGHTIIYYGYTGPHWASFTGRFVNVRLRTDTCGAGAGFRVSQYSFSTWTNWQPFGETSQWRLSGDEGLNRVYIQLRDKLGLETAILSTDIILDALPPGGPGRPQEGSPDVDHVQPPGVYLVNWAPSPDPDLSYYSLEERRGSGTWEVLAWTIPSTSYLITHAGEPEGTTFYYRVRAQSMYSLAWGPYSPVSDGVTIDSVPPSPPSGVTAAFPTFKEEPPEGAWTFQYGFQTTSPSGQPPEVTEPRCMWDPGNVCWKFWAYDSDDRYVGLREQQVGGDWRLSVDVKVPLNPSGVAWEFNVEGYVAPMPVEAFTFYWLDSDGFEYPMVTVDKLADDDLSQTFVFPANSLAGESELTIRIRDTSLDFTEHTLYLDRTWVKTSLTGPTAQDVLVSWVASSSSDVEEYWIFRSSSLSGFDFGMPPLAKVPKTATYWIDRGAGFDSAVAYHDGSAGLDPWRFVVTPLRDRHVKATQTDTGLYRFNLLNLGLNVDSYSVSVCSADDGYWGPVEFLPSSLITLAPGQSVDVQVLFHGGGLLYPTRSGTRSICVNSLNSPPPELFETLAVVVDVFPDGSPTNHDVNYFYAVAAVDAAGNRGVDAYDLGAKFSIAVDQGWTLISSPLEQDDVTPSSVLASLDAIRPATGARGTTYRLVQHRDASDPQDPWKCYQSPNPITLQSGGSPSGSPPNPEPTSDDPPGIPPFCADDLTAITHRIGFWLKMELTDTWRIAGKVPRSLTVTLYPGENMVGFPSFRPDTVASVFVGVPYTEVRGYHPADSQISTRQLSPTDIVSLGRGYLVTLPPGVQWTWDLTNDYAAGPLLELEGAASLLSQSSQFKLEVHARNALATQAEQLSLEISFTPVPTPFSALDISALPASSVTEVQAVWQPPDGRERWVIFTLTDKASGGWIGEQSLYVGNYPPIAVAEVYQPVTMRVEALSTHWQRIVAEVYEDGVVVASVTLTRPPSGDPYGVGTAAFRHHQLGNVYELRVEYLSYEIGDTTVTVTFTASTESRTLQFNFNAPPGTPVEQRQDVTDTLEDMLELIDEFWFDGRASYDLDGSVVTYLWDFGDGISASGSHVSHTYSGGCMYAVVLTVTDTRGAIGTDDAFAQVDPCLPPPPPGPGPT